MKAMSYEPELRYQRVEELQAELVAWQGGFAPKAERASLGKQIWLWTVRHKTEVTMVSSFVVLAFGAIIWALIHLKAERDKAIFAQRQAEQALEQAAKSESKAAQMLGELREAAYIFASEADSLIEAGNFKEALRVLDDAIEKKPEEIAFRLKRGNILESMFAFQEALKAYQKAQEMQPNNETAHQNIALLQRIIPRTTEGELPPMLVLYELHKAMLDQGRLDEAIAVSKRVTDDRQMFQQTMRATMTRFGLREDRWQQTESGNLVLNLSRINLMEGFGPKKFRLINLRELRNRPVVELRIENSSVPDLTPLAGWRLEVLVAGGNPIVDLSPLRGMPLRELNIAGTFVRDLTPLMGMPLEILDASETRVGSLKPLGKSKIEELNVSGCKAITDIADLKDLPLQKLNLSNTGVVSVAALAGSRIRELRLEGCRSVTDLRPLLRCESLETLILPNHLKDVEYLREHPSLRWLSYRRSSQTIAEFWAENSKK
jgi:tetratricopeptide (TPR) repeat protein